MRLDKSWKFIENQLRNIGLPKSLLQCATAMRKHLEPFTDKGVIRRDLRIPRIHKVPDDDCKESVELTVHLVGAREGRKQLFQRLHARPRTEDSTDQRRRGLLIGDLSTSDRSWLATVADAK